MVAMQSHYRFEHWEALKLFYSPTIQSRFNFVFSISCWFTDRTGVRMGFLVPCGAVQGGVVWSVAQNPGTSKADEGELLSV